MDAYEGSDRTVAGHEPRTVPWSEAVWLNPPPKAEQDGADPAGSTTRTAYDLIADASGPGFGPGANGPMTIVVNVQHATEPVSRIGSTVGSALQNTSGVARITPLTATPDGRFLISTLTPSGGPQTAAVGGLFDTLVHQTLPDALHGTGASGYVTGSTAGQFDFRDTVSSRLPIIIGIVLAAAFLLLTTVFRSLLIPLKAVVLNLLTTGASYGVLVAMFQWGWGDHLFGLSEPVPIESYVPMMMFAIVFGLSMDYEIFLLSRISEAWHGGADNTRAVGGGLAATGRVISSAAFIMTAVFLSFTASPTVVVKMLALGLAASVVLDATVVRGAGALDDVPDGQGELVAAPTAGPGAAAHERVSGPWGPDHAVWQTEKPIDPRETCAYGKRPRCRIRSPRPGRGARPGSWSPPCWRCCGRPASH